MRGSISRFVCFLTAFVCAALGAGADMVVNGSFESPHPGGPYQYVAGGSTAISGWQTILSGVERFDPGIYGAGSAQDGQFCLDLNTDFGVGGGIQQTFATNAGQSYILSFHGGTWFDRGRNGTANIEVFIDGNGYPFTVVNLMPTIVWTPLTLTFQAMTSSTTIAFRNFDGPNETFSLLDNVSLEAIPMPPTDDDGDGVVNDIDQCPGSDANATIVIDGCDTGVPNTLSPSGCKISDSIAECAANARNHGQFVSCVSYVTNRLKKAGTITGKQKGAIESCAAQSNIP
jgi:hypothetical protein